MTMSVPTRDRSGSEGGRSSKNTSTNRIGMDMSSASFSHEGGGHTVGMHGPKTRPDYGHALSRDASRRFYRAHLGYERSVRISRRGKSVPHYLLSVNKLLLRYIRIPLKSVSFNGTELPDDQLMGGLGHHGGMLGGGRNGPLESGSRDYTCIIDRESSHSA